jgi:XTP/dITP diphosphohydrolase
LDLEVVSLEDSSTTEGLEEGVTFQQNALLKARHFRELTGLPTIADDSGLEVFALDGAPGVHSARFGGPDATDEQRIEKLLLELGEIPRDLRGARFVCAAALVWESGERVFTGEACGEILTAPKGEAGFGYDPVFYSPELERTFAEVSSSDKARVSHRGRAFGQLASWLLGPGVLDMVGSGDRIAYPTKEPSASVD